MTEENINELDIPFTGENNPFTRENENFHYEELF
jgi:hypothetical protein